MYKFNLGILAVAASVIEDVLHTDKSKYIGRYGDVFRTLLFNTFGINLGLINSYAGKHKTAIHFNCKHCKQQYKLTGKSKQLTRKSGMEYALLSNNPQCCQCAM